MPPKRKRTGSTNAAGQKKQSTATAALGDSGAAAAAGGATGRHAAASVGFGIGTRARRWFEVISEVVPALSYDVSALIVQYASARIGFITQSGALTVWDVDSCREVSTTPHAVAGDCDGLITLACPPLPDGRGP